MNVNDILDSIEDMLERSFSVPLSKGRCVVDADKVSDYLGDIRLNLPKEIKEARHIVTDRNQIISEAKKEAEHIVKNAEERAKRIVNEDSIVKQAQERANEMMTSAHTQSRDVRKAATEFTEKIMSESEEALIASVNKIREARSSVKKKK